MPGGPENYEYWLISIPNQKQQQKAVAQLKHTVSQRGQGECYPYERLPISHLKVGTLDSLISLSDELGRIDNAGKGIIQKLHSAYSELEGDSGGSRGLDIDRSPLRNYIQQFRWDEGHFDSRLSLPQLVQQIQSRMTRTQEQLRKQQSTVNEIISTLQSVERKTSGSLMNKNLGKFVTRDVWVEGEYLATALVVIPKNKTEDFLNNYESMEDSHENERLKEAEARKQEQRQAQRAEYERKLAAAKEALEANKDKGDDAPAVVMPIPPPDEGKESDVLFGLPNCRTVVPNSALELAKDDDFVLYRVILLKKGMDWFRNVCREKGIAVRNFNIDNDESKTDEEHRQRLLDAKRDKEGKMKLFCKSNFSDAFKNWMHLKIIRTFVEAVLRFGLPVDFSISCVKPQLGNEKRLLKSLESGYSHLGNKILQKGKGGGDDIDYSGLGGEFYPFVYIPIKFEL